MDLRQTFARLHAAGILMRARGDRLSVASRAPLTDQQRAMSDWRCASTAIGSSTSRIAG